MRTCLVGAASVEITPPTSQFLFGYPHVERSSTGVHDPLLTSAMYIEGNTGAALFIANDIIYVDKRLTAAVRRRIRESTGIPEKAVLVSATHTHSGPIVVSHASNRLDTVVPEPDPAYRDLLIDRMVQAARAAVSSAHPAKIGFGLAHAEGVGCNRRSPDGVQDSEVPILLAINDAENPIACMVVYSMHPTVLHEDSKLVSADFPGFTRRYLQDVVFQTDVPVLYHNGTAGNQSPRHVARGNTFEEAERLGIVLGKAIAERISELKWFDTIDVRVASKSLDLPMKSIPIEAQARDRMVAAERRLESLRSHDASQRDVRTAETDWFGATEVLALARAQSSGELEAYYDRALPAEVQVIAVGPHCYIAWPGELFVEYGLELKRRVPDTFGITLANGELQGYVVTEAAAKQGGYEASNALFHWSSGPILVDLAVELVKQVRQAPTS